ncbi:helix-turn-helix domain-containing protein [Jannaschia sp.]|nr:helix-turn-helix domain-containing protein [Jannaschia sp.]
MTAYSNLARPFGDRLPSDETKKAAATLREVLAATYADGGALELRDRGGVTTSVTLSPEMTELLMSVLRPISQGDAVALIPIGKQLTTQEAADILNVSRPHLIKLIDAGDLVCSLVGRHRRIAYHDLLDYKAERDSIRETALTELAQIDSDLI